MIFRLRVPIIAAEYEIMQRVRAGRVVVEDKPCTAGAGRVSRRTTSLCARRGKPRTASDSYIHQRKGISDGTVRKARNAAGGRGHATIWR